MTLSSMTAPAFRATRGDTLTWTFTIPENITGWTPKWSLKAQDNWPDTLDTGALITATVSGGALAVTPGATSTITLTLAATATAALAPGVYVWDLQLVSGANVRTIEWDAEGNAYGTLTIKPDVTRVTT